MVPANKIGSSINGGPFNIWQLKLIQEVVSISVFVVFTLLVFKPISLNGTIWWVLCSYWELFIFSLKSKKGP